MIIEAVIINEDGSGKLILSDTSILTFTEAPEEVTCLNGQEIMFQISGLYIAARNLRGRKFASFRERGKIEFVDRKSFLKATARS